MNYNKNKQENIEVDEMKIKSHLNASLDLSGISVSEDLINRTLQAIKKQESEQQATEADKTSPEDEHKKVIPWNRYARTFAGVAAAAIVVVAGYGLIKGGLLTAQKSESTTDSSVQMTYDTASTESAADSTMSAATDSATADSAASSTEEAATATEDPTNAFTAQQNTSGAETTTGAETTAGAEATTEEPQYSITFDSDMAETDAGEGVYGSTNDATVGARTMLKGTEDTSVLTFRDIVLADPAQASKVTIADALNGITVTLTTEEAILDFYSVMDGQQFTYATESASETVDYTIEITAAPDAALYTMTVGDYITVVYTGDETTSQSLYDAVDLESLKQSLSDLCLKYNQ
jgi:hypothetical protein